MTYAMLLNLLLSFCNISDDNFQCRKDLRECYVKTTEANGNWNDLAFRQCLGSYYNISYRTK